MKRKQKDERQKRLFDGEGLYIEDTSIYDDKTGKVIKKGSKLWRMKYRFNGKPGLLALGKYPEISLEQARKKRIEARELIARGIHPSEAKKALKAANRERAANTFAVIALEWFEKQIDVWSENYSNLI